MDVDGADIVAVLFIAVVIISIIIVVVLSPPPNYNVSTQIRGAYLYMRSGNEVLNSSYNPNFTVNVYGGEKFPVMMSLYNFFSKPVEVYDVTVGNPLSLVSVSPKLPIIIEPNQSVNVTLQVSSPYWQSYMGPLSVTVYVNETPIMTTTTETIASVSTTTQTVTSTQTSAVTTTVTQAYTVTDYGPLGVPPYVLLVGLIVVVMVAVITLRR